MKCISCGADIAFDAKTQKLKCEYCGSEFDPNGYDENQTVAKEQKPVIEMETKSFSCKQCGATLLTFDDTAVTFCSYCGSSNILESELYKTEMPEYVIPFKITKEQCEEIYKKEIRKHFFAPKEMRDDVVIKKFRGIYMPYAVYKAEHKGPQQNSGEKYSHRSGNYDYYDKFTITANVNAEYEGMSYDLSSSFYDRFSNAIAPFDFTEAKKFDANYLSGFYADSRDVQKNIYEEEAKEIIAPSASNELSKHKEYKMHGCYNPTVSFNITDTKVAYYPVYFLAIRNKANDRVNYAVINGQTGKVAVELPIDYKKYITFSAIIALIFFVALLISNILILPKILVFISIAFSIVNLFIITKQRKNLIKQENHDDDKGYMDKFKQTVKTEDKNKKKDKKDKKEEQDKNTPKGGNYIFGLVASILICGATIAYAPVNDLYYYVVSLASLLFTLLSFKSVIMQFNELTSRKLSQIGIRGGDEIDV